MAADGSACAPGRPAGRCSLSCYVFALTYGPGTDWVKNVLAEGGCELHTRGRTIALTEPRLFRDESRAAIRPFERQVLRALNVTDFLSLKTAPAAQPGRR